MKEKIPIIVVISFLCLVLVFSLSFALSWRAATGGKDTAYSDAVILFEDRPVNPKTGPAGIVTGLITNTATETITETIACPVLVLAEKNSSTPFRLVYDGNTGFAVRQNILSIQDTFFYQYHIDLPVCSDSEEPAPFEIIVGASGRDSCRELMDSLSPGEYAIRTVSEKGNSQNSYDSVQIVIAYNGEYARMEALDRFISEYCLEQGVMIPSNLDIRGSCVAEDVVITSSIPRLRDPFILLDNGVYYAYGTGWHCWKNTSGSLSGSWQDLGICVEAPPNADTNYWAPEVYRYNGRYYMITTYHSTYTWRRGCAVFTSDSPEGPFVELSAGHITPGWRDSIDGTLYLDEDCQPWLVYVQEWTYNWDQIGRMAAARLSDDLTKCIDSSVELFRADTPVWANGRATDGCWVYRCSTGELLMLWSNNDISGYAVGIARSENGKIDGPWIHDDALLYSKSLTGDYSGGHPMTFTDSDGQLYLAIHAPNVATGDRKEKPVFIPIKERNGTLVWDLWNNDDPSDLYDNLIKVRLNG